MPPTIPSRSFPISSPRRHPFLHSFPTRRSSDLAHKRCWIGRANAVEQALKVARQSKGSRQACNSAGQGESNALPHNQAEDIALLRPHCGTNADFASAASHFIGKEAIQTNASESQGQQAEEARKVRDQPLSKKGAVNLFGLRREISWGKVAVELVNDAASRGNQRFRSCRRAKVKVDSSFFKGKVFGGFDRLFQIVIFCIASHADDFRARIVLRCTRVQTKGAATLQISLRESPVD